VLTIGLVALSAGVWASPSARRWAQAPDPRAVELATQRARADDLKRRLDEATDRLRERRPDDAAERARADDLSRRLDDAEAQLGRPRPDEGAAVARADDLAERLRQAADRLRAPRPPSGDPVQRARAEDLATQVRTLTERLSRPRAPVESAVTATMTRAEIVAARHLFGLYTTQSPFNFAEVNAVEAAVERRADIVGYFQSWADEFRPDAVRETWSRGAVPLITWESRSVGGPATGGDDPAYSLPVILSGRYDDYLRRWARGVRDLGLPLIMRFDHEMNAPWYPWAEVAVSAGTNVNGNRRGDFARTWRHVHDIFTQEGANDLVVWLWSPNRVNRIPQQPPPVEFYPGDDYVDWIGMSGYHRSYDPAPTFDDTFGPTLRLLRAAAAKPILLAEIGATEIGGDKAAWERDLFRGLAGNPDIVGFAWFNLTVTSSVGGELVTNDWRIDSSRASIEAMRDGLALSGLGRPLVPG
jgi:hypothetical protein